MALVDKAGKVIEIGKVDPATAGLLETALEGLEARMTEAVSKAMGPVAETVKAVTDKIAAIEAGAKQPPKDAPADAPKVDPKGDLGKQIGDMLTAAMGPVLKQVEELKGTLAAKDQQSALEAQVDSYIKTTRPNLTGAHAARLRRELLAAKPKDEAAMKGVADGLAKELRDLGVPNVDKLFGADKVAEGGKGGAAANEKQAAAEALLAKYTGKPKQETAL